MLFQRLHERVVEQTATCAGSGGILHTVFYRPDSTMGPPVLIVPPDGEERNWALRSLVTVARSLAVHGCPVLRFDYFGQGESDGNYEDTTIATRLTDVTMASRLLRDHTGRTPAVLGVRLGATLAVAAAAAQPLTRQLILWEPVLNTDAYLQQLLRVNVSTQMVTHGRVIKERPELMAQARGGQHVSVNGYQLSGSFIDGLLELDPHVALQRVSGRVLMVATAGLPASLTALPHVTAAHVAAPPFWKEPKIHTVATTPFLGPTFDWLLASVRQRQEAS